MKSSPELLTDILYVLGKINSNIEAMRGGAATPGAPTGESRAARGLGLNLSEVIQDKDKSKGLRDTAAAIKDLSSALGPLSAGLIKFALIPKTLKRSVTDFIHEFLVQSNIKGVEASVAAKEVARSIGIIATSLPKLAQGVFSFGVVSKLGLVKAACLGLDMIFATLSAAAPLAPIMAPAAAAIGAIGLALNGIANVLKSIALLVLSFSTAIIIMVGAIYLATKAFNVGPLAAMGIIVGSIAILAGGFALIGLLSPAIARAGKAVAEMGKGMALIGAGLLAYVGSLALVNLITGSQEKTNEAIASSIKSVALMSLLFAGLGLIGGAIARGGFAIQRMGVGMLAMAGGLLAIGGVFKILDMMKIDAGYMLASLAKGLAILGLTFAALGLLSVLIIPGTLVLLAIGASITLFALVTMGITAIINKLGGKDGLLSASDNIALMVGGVLRGVTKGISVGLLGEPGDRPASFFGKVGKVAGNVAILISSIGLLMGVSFALIAFAFSLKAFTKAGSIRTITGYKSTGEPIYGDTVNVVSAGENIAKSVGSFFTTLTRTFKNPAIIPDKNDVEKIVDILMGNQGFRILGIRLLGRKRPGLIDALSKFGSLITLFAKSKQIPIYEVDDKGNTKIKSYTDPNKVAINIVDALKSFFGAFKSKQTELEGISTETSSNIAQILLGRQAPRLLGFKIPFTKDKPGILEPILKFTEVLVQYSKFGDKNELPVQFDENGKVIESIAVDKIATNMVKGISSFLNSFNVAFNQPGTMSGIENSAKHLDKALINFSSVITKFDTLSKSLTGIDKLSTSIGNLATNIGLLVDNMSGINVENLEKLSKTATKYAASLPPASAASMLPISASSPQISESDWNKFAEIVGQKIAEKISGLNTGEFQFRFMDTNVGNLSIQR